MVLRALFGCVPCGFTLNIGEINEHPDLLPMEFHRLMAGLP